MSLYEASFRGSVTTLNALIQSDRLILHRELSLTSFSETPLHISSLLGHLDFTRELLRLKPELATVLNSLRSSPLHSASAEGHTEILKALLQVNRDVCLVRDQGGRIPLHLAVMRGYVEVIQELISSRPSSIQEKLEGDTVLHLCIRYNQLEALKLLVSAVRRDREFLNLLDRNGNTILNLAAVLKQVETVKYLVSISEVRVEPNALVEAGLTAALENHPTAEFRNLGIQDNLQEAGNRRASKNQRIPQPHSLNAVSQNVTQVAAETTISKWKEFENYQGHWLEKTRGILMVVATVIATMTFQVSIAPPGGFWQQDITGNGCPPNVTCRAGTSVLAYIHKEKYHEFTIYSTISFSSSLSIILLLISGFPLKNRVTLWVLTLTMCTTVIFMAVTYMTSINLVKNPEDTTFNDITKYYKYFWLGLLAIIIVVHILRLIFWLIKKLLICAYYIFIWPMVMMCRCILPQSRANEQSSRV